MSTVHSVHLTLKAVRLLELCEAEGFENIESLLVASIFDSVCPAICMECGSTAQMEPDQRAGYCEQCGKNKVVSALILAGSSTFSGGKVMMTSGVHELPDCVRADALVKVATFSQFTRDNDPYGDHDFGHFELVGRTFYWKIDLYEEPNVKDANGEPFVNRVLTIMLADEY
jgi:hypothetical protein